MVRMVSSPDIQDFLGASRWLQAEKHAEDRAKEASEDLLGLFDETSPYQGGVLAPPPIGSGAESGLPTTERFLWKDVPDVTASRPLWVVQRPVTHGRITGPVQFLIKLIDYWGLEHDHGSVLLGLHLQDYSDVVRGVRTLRGRDPLDRIKVLARIRTLLHELFRDKDTERGWLHEAQQSLQGKCPLDLALDGSFQNLLGLEEFVKRASGR